MSAKLVAYEYVPLGFEMAIEKKEVKAWNLWWNVKLTDDPEARDKEILTEYARSFEKWLRQGLPESPIELKVFGFLGQPTKTKEAFVEKLVSIIESEELPSISSLKKLSKDECRKTNGEFETLGFRPFICFLPACWPEGMILGKRVCCYFMFIDAGLLCAGMSG